MDPTETESVYYEWCFKKKDIRDDFMRAITLSAKLDLASHMKDAQKVKSLLEEMTLEDDSVIDFMDHIRNEKPLATMHFLDPEKIKKMSGSEMQAYSNVMTGMFIGWCFSRWLIARDTRQKVEKYAKAYLVEENIKEGQRD